MALKPEWLKVKAPGGENYVRIKRLLRERNLHTVCEEARCPNVGECWGGGTATFMLLGDVCTRACRFCAVAAGNPKGIVDGREPEKTAEALAALGLEYVVLTMVNRDDLPDQGAAHVARTIRLVREAAPDLILETLVGDFQGDTACIRQVVDAAPHVFGHNIETTEPLQRKVRDARANYAQSLAVLEYGKKLAPERFTKSSIMLGLGETAEDLARCYRDLRGVGVDFLTLGQYLQPSKWHLPVERFVSPQEFDDHRARALEAGFRYVASGPLVRSSYRAGEFYMASLIREAAGGPETR
ncbi:MAG: lipoyl synthase [Planctomycetes bacterium]|nr:lipoyl synthase [Planctomycetota bacterium]